VENLDCPIFYVFVVWEYLIFFHLIWGIECICPSIISPYICRYTHCTILAHYYYCGQKELLCAECSAYVEIFTGYGRSSPFKWKGILNEKWLKETWILNLYVAGAASIFRVSSSTKNKWQNGWQRHIIYQYEMLPGLYVLINWHKPRGVGW
jgi:hypothetical protein